MPERQKAHCERARVFRDEHPCAFGLAGQAVSQSGHELLKLAPTDRTVGGRVAPRIPGDFRIWIAPLLEQVTEGAHPSRLSTTN